MDINGSMQKSKRVKGYIFWHKEVPYGIWSDEIWTPIQANTKNNGRIETYGGIADNEGVDNISYWNPFYAETTCMYSIWKNHPKDCEYIMQTQYRRRFDIHSEEDLDNMFEKHNVLAAAPLYLASTVAQQYVSCHSPEDLPKIKQILLNLYPEYEESWVKHIENGHLLFYSNGAAFRKDDYDRYCKWLFSILTEYKKELGYNTVEELDNAIQRQMKEGRRRSFNGYGRPENAVQYQRQLGGFASERLLTLYLLHNYPQDKIGVTQYLKMENCF